MPSRLLRLHLAPLLAAASLEAQTAALQPGTWIRVWSGHGRTVGVLVSHDAARLSIARGARSDLTVEELRGLPLRDTVSVSTARLTLIEVYDGRRSRAGTGALVGFVTGFAFGALVGAAVGCGPTFHVECSRAAGIAVNGVALGAVGAGVGALRGRSIRSDRWREVALPRVTPRVAPLGEGGLGIGIAISF